MKKVHYEDINDQQLIDLRDQNEFRAGHIKQSINLIPKNLTKYASHYIKPDQPIILITDSKDDTMQNKLFKIENQLDLSEEIGFMSIDEYPTHELQTTDSASAEEFLNNTTDYVLLDVRHPDEITRPAPEDFLVNIPFEKLADDYDKLGVNLTIYTLCGSGNRGTAAASFLQSKGYHPIVIEGGMKAIDDL